ncbi:MAG: hemolysin III family protein [Rhodanobacteraceae bacterium]|jgi:hemolysin III|nr:MAG: hemolysin III family protein [Rhodanobacteraceae bacterium]
MTRAGWLSSAGYTFGEEVANGVVQSVGILLSIAGLTTLVAFAAVDGHALDVTASAVFGATLILMYTVSTIYHAVPVHVAPRVLSRLDHIAIHLLIAGTYTPFALITLGGARGWWLFGAIWALAVFGSALQFTRLRERNALKIGLYLLMGWLGLLTFAPLSARLGFGGTALLLAGGAAYTLGVPFHLWKKLRYHNVLWHAFVLLGSVLHFFAVLFYVLPA